MLIRVALRYAMCTRPTTTSVDGSQTLSWLLVCLVRLLRYALACIVMSELHCTDSTQILRTYFLP